MSTNLVTFVANRRAEKGKKQIVIEDHFKKQEKEIVDKLFANMIYQCGLSFNLVNQLFVEVVCEAIGRYGRGYVLPSYHHIQKTLLEKSYEDVAELKLTYEPHWRKYGVTIMNDGWTDKRGRSLLNFLVNCPKGTFFLNPIEASSEEKNADFIVKVIEEHMRLVGVENVVQICLDNASNFVLAGKKLMEKYSQLYWTPCVAHCLDLLLEDIGKLPHLKRVIATGRKITSYIYSHTRLHSYFFKCSKKKKLVRCGVTRFAISYLTLQSLYEMKGILRALFVSTFWFESPWSNEDQGKLVANAILSTKYWDVLEDCLRASQPILQVLRLVDSDDNPSMEYVLVALGKTVLAIRENFRHTKEDYQPIVDLINRRMKMHFDHSLFGAGAFLNPLVYYTERECVESSFADLYEAKFHECVEKMVQDSKETMDVMLAMEEYKAKRGKLDSRLAQDLMKIFQPLNWWDTHGVLPLALKKIAIRILGLCCTASNCERSWSTFEIIQSKRRLNLDLERLKKLVFIKYNKSLHERFEKRRAQNNSEDFDPIRVEDLNYSSEWMTGKTGAFNEFIYGEEELTWTEDKMVNGDDHVPRIQLEDLIGMIKNAEKNIVLLNEARISAVEDLNKILAEKEVLQRHVNVLEVKLAETEGHIYAATQEKEQTRNELYKLKNGINKETEDHVYHAHENGRKVLNPEDPSFSIDDLSLGEQVASLRKENSLLKLSNLQETNRISSLEKERSTLSTSIKRLESTIAASQEDVHTLTALKFECKALHEKVENLQGLLDCVTKQADQAVNISEKNDELQRKVEKLEASLEGANANNLSSEKTKKYIDILESKVKMLENQLDMSDRQITAHIQLYESSVQEFNDTLNNLKEETKKRSSKENTNDMSWEFWSRLLLIVEAWLLEKKISSDDANALREMAWKKDKRIQDAYFTSIGNNDPDVVTTFLKLMSSRERSCLNVVHIAAEMAPVAKVGGLGDVVSGLCKALQRRGHLVEVILPKYDCMQGEQINDLRMLHAVLETYFDGQLFKNKIWVGIVEGLPVYFIEPLHPDKFFLRGNIYGEVDDFRRFSYFSRAALEFLHHVGKKPDIIHCHDWHTAFVAPLYWEIYARNGFNSARICFTCHNFEYQGTAHASELSSCGLDVYQLNKPDRMQDNLNHDRVNLVKGATVFSNIVTTVSPTYADEVRTVEGGQGLFETLILHSKKFFGILNGIDIDSWNPTRDHFLRFQYDADDLRGKVENKDALRKYLKLSSTNTFQPLVGCITRLVPQKGVHLIRHAIYRTLELGGQFILLGSSPVSHIQREFEDIANNLQNHPHARLILKYDEALSRSIYAASDMLVIPSIFEPCGLTQMIAMRYGSVPIVRRTGGLNDSVFDVDDDTIPDHFQNGFTFMSADEQGLNNAMERAFNLYTKTPDIWQQLIQKNMRTDFSWHSSSEQYEQLYEKAIARAREASRLQVSS